MKYIRIKAGDFDKYKEEYLKRYKKYFNTEEEAIFFLDQMIKSKTNKYVTFYDAKSDWFSFLIKNKLSPISKEIKTKIINSLKDKDLLYKDFKDLKYRWKPLIYFQSEYTFFKEYHKCWNCGDLTKKVSHGSLCSKCIHKIIRYYKSEMEEKTSKNLFKEYETKPYISKISIKQALERRIPVNTISNFHSIPINQVEQMKKDIHNKNYEIPNKFKNYINKISKEEIKKIKRIHSSIKNLIKWIFDFSKYQIRHPKFFNHIIITTEIKNDLQTINSIFNLLKKIEEGKK